MTAHCDNGMSLPGDGPRAGAEDGGNNMINKDDRTGARRKTTNSEDRDIKGHLADYPECDGSMIVDNHDQTVQTARPYLQCAGCDVAVDPV